MLVTLDGTQICNLGEKKAYQVRIIFVLKMVTEFFKLLKTVTQKAICLPSHLSTNVIFLPLINKIST